MHFYVKKQSIAFIFTRNKTFFEPPGRLFDNPALHIRSLTALHVSCMAQNHQNVDVNRINAFLLTVKEMAPPRPPPPTGDGAPFRPPPPETDDEDDVFKNAPSASQPIMVNLKLIFSLKKLILKRSKRLPLTIYTEKLDSGLRKTTN